MEISAATMVSQGAMCKTFFFNFPSRMYDFDHANFACKLGERIRTWQLVQMVRMELLLIRSMLDTWIHFCHGFGSRVQLRFLTKRQV